MMGRLFIVVSVLATAGLVAATFAIGGVAPLSPAEMARGTVQARDDLKQAIENTTLTADQTRSFEVIATNVRRQLLASKRILEIQVGLERASKLSVANSGRVRDRIKNLLTALQKVEKDIDETGALSARMNDVAATAGLGAARLSEGLERLGARFVQVIEESRKLDRKARAFAQVGRLP
ncbi:MAG: hypothetical protein QOH90_412 [Actinomycetota bacterium]|nr:hypothetical protein [Actinomycetota bacterium]